MENKVKLLVYSSDTSWTVISDENFPIDEKRREVLFGKNYKFEYAVIGDSYNECMQKHYDKMGFGTYKPFEEDNDE